MKSVYVVLEKWYSWQYDVMNPITPDRSSVKIFSSKNRAVRYLQNRIAYHKQLGREVDFLNCTDYEFRVDFMRDGILFRVECVLTKYFINLYDNE